MTNRLRVSVLLRAGTFCVTALALSAAAWGQDAGDNPFADEAVAADDAGAVEEGADEPPMEEAATGGAFEDAGGQPVEAPPAAPPAARSAAPTPAADAPTLADFARRDPTIAAVLGLPRATPAEKLGAVLTLIDLNRSDVAALVLPELLQTELDDAQRAALVKEFGSAAFMKLIRLDAPAPVEGQAGPLAGLRDFAQRSLDAAAAQARDPGRVAALVAQLNAATAEERYAARVDLQESGEVGVIACFAALAQAESPEARGNIMAAVMDMRPLVDEPLLAVLADATGQLEMDAADLAGRMRLSAAVPWLSVVAASPPRGPAAAMAANGLASLGLAEPTPAEVEKLLRDKLAGVATEPVNTIDEGLRGVWWSWDPAAKQLLAKQFAPKQLRTLAAARWSRALAEVGGLADPADVRRVVIYELEEAALLGRPVSPAVQPVLAGMSAPALNDALGAALAADLRPASIALAAEIAARGDASVLVTSSGRPSPLAAALTNPSRDVRFAALASVMKLAPANSFPGSSHVTAALWHFASGAGQPTAVAAAPDIVAASDWAGQLRAAGYDATPVRTGREAMLAAATPAMSAKLGVVVLDSDIGQPLLGEVVFQLHAAEPTRGVPVLVCSSAPRLSAAERIAASDPLVLAVARPHREGELASLVEQARAMSGRPFPPNEVRTAQAQQALTWIGQLLAAGGPYDELHRDAGILNQTLHVPELTEATLAVLARLGTAESQLLLVDHASAMAQPLETRQAAATAFAASVQQAGLRLSRDAVLRQYDRYNASEKADAGTQQVLGQILDVIERKPPAPQP